MARRPAVRPLCLEGSDMALERLALHCQPVEAGIEGEPHAKGLLLTSRNIACGMFDDSSYSYVNCQSRVPPQNVTMHASGRLTICRDPTPSNVTNDCNLGHPGEASSRSLPTASRSRSGAFAASPRTRVRCTVIRSGKGFLINRDFEVSRVGP